MITGDTQHRQLLKAAVKNTPQCSICYDHCMNKYPNVTAQRKCNPHNLKEHLIAAHNYPLFPKRWRQWWR